MSAKFDDFGKRVKEILNNINDLKDDIKLLKENNIKLYLNISIYLNFEFTRSKINLKLYCCNLKTNHCKYLT